MRRAPLGMGTLGMVALIGLAGTIVFVPGLHAGFFLDDYYHQAALHGLDRNVVSAASRLNLYNFYDGEPEPSHGVQGNFVPWWADPEQIRLGFWRPLSSLSLWLDYQVHGDSPYGYHVTSLVLWALLVLAVIWLYYLLAAHTPLPRAVAPLAGLLFAVDDAHMMPVVWVANRHATLSVLLSVGALAFYHRFRARGKAWTPWLLSMVLFILGLLAGETAFYLVLWIIAYELTVAADSVRRRMMAAAPLLVIALAYILSYTVSGYGASGWAYYLSPLDEPARFLYAAVTERVPQLLIGLLTPIPAQTLAQQEGLPSWLVPTAAYGLAVLLLVIARRLLRRDRIAAFMGLAGTLSLVVAAAPEPHNRALLLPSVAFAWLLSAITAALAQQWARSRATGAGRGIHLPDAWHRLAAPVVAALLVVHLVVAPHDAIQRSSAFAGFTENFRTQATTAEMPTTPQSAHDARVVVLDYRHWFVGFGFQLTRWAAGLPWPAGVWTVAVHTPEMTISRPGDKALTLSSSGAGLLPDGPRLWPRAPDLAEGHTYRRGALTVTPQAIEGDQVHELTFKLDRSLDSADVWLLSWDGRRYRRIRPPPIGESMPLHGG